jgi:hypothetical protein
MCTLTLVALLVAAALLSPASAEPSMKQQMTQHIGIILLYKEKCGTVHQKRMQAVRDIAPTLDRFELLNQMVEIAPGDSAARSTTGSSAQATFLTSIYQTTHRANADTITPAQYQRRSASSLIGSSSLFRGGLYTHSLSGWPPRTRISGKTSSIAPARINGAALFET